MGLFSAATSRWRPFSLSYGTILPNSLTILLPSALGFSPHLPVSVCGTGSCKTIAAFLGSRLFTLRYSYVRSPSRPRFLTGGFPPAKLLRLDRSFHSRLVFSDCVPTVLSASGTGISTRFPSTTPLGLALGPDLPRADQPCPGNLRYSAARILTLLSLLIPAFSLPVPPLPLSVQLRQFRECSSTTCSCLQIRSFGVVF